MAKVATTRTQRLNPRTEELAPAGAGAEWSVARSLGGEPGPIGLVGTLDPAGRDVLNPTTMTASQGAVVQSYAAIDYLGRSTASGDINGDGHVDLILGAGNQAFVIFGGAGGIPAITSLATLPQAAGFVMLGGPGDDAGYSVAAADINNDGYDDVIVSALTGNTGSATLGEAYVIYGHAGPFGALDGAGRGVIDLTTFGAATGFVAPSIAGTDDNVGHAVASAGDVNDDGFEDILLGAHLLYGHAGSFGTVNGAGRAILDLYMSSVTILGDQDDVHAGASVSSAGDLNADGFDDFIIGAPWGADDAPFKLVGEYYVVFGKAAGLGTPDGMGGTVLDLGDLLPADGFFVRNAGLFFNLAAGAQPEITRETRASSAAPAGDVNGDGFADIILNRGRSGDGGALVLFGHAGGFGTVDASGRAQIDGAAVTPAQGFYIPLASTVGFDVSGAGDFNGDGIDDLIVSRMLSSGGAGTPRMGEAYVIYGSAAIGELDGSGRRIVDVAHLAPADGFVISDNLAPSGLAGSVSAAGDVNHDGYDDILVGASHLGGEDGGAYVIYGRPFIAPGAIVGTPGPDMLNGTPGNDVIHGLAGNDSIDGLAGADELHGGDGDDFYHVDNVGDLVVESDGMGNDVVIASISYVLNPAEVEYLITDDGNATVARNLTGNEFAQQIWGNQGANILAGAGGNDTLIGFAGNDFLDGGAGADAMLGGLGDDIYVIDTTGLFNLDFIVEAVGEGFDILIAPVGGALSAGAEIELITTGWIEGTTESLIDGNEFAQHIWGNNARNTLRGGGGDDTLFGFGGNDSLQGGDGNDLLFGGAGSDSLQGGNGDDYYVLDDPTDTLFEDGGSQGGYDIVVAPFSFTFDDGDAVELVTTGFIAGTAAIDYTGGDPRTEFWGNDGANVIDGGFGEDVIIGFGGNDIIDGGGHNDILIGGAGQDIFRFTIVPSNTLNFNNIDTIGDYSVADDSIQLDDIVYSALPQGALNPAAFVLGTAAADADDRIIYDAATGRLFYDADGNGAGAAIQFAVLSGSPAITASDFQII